MSSYKKSIEFLRVDTTLDQYAREVRLQYWEKLFHNVRPER